MAPGIHCSGPEGVTQRIAEGFQFLAMASELKFLLSGLQDALAAVPWSPSARATIGQTGELAPAEVKDAIRY